MSRPALLLLILSLMIPDCLRSQSADSSAGALVTLINQLPPTAQVRLATAGELWSGRLAAQTADTVTVVGEAGTRALPLTAIDTLWVLKPHRHRALLAGIGFGAIMFGVLQLGGGSAEDPGINTQLGLMFLGGGTALGLLVDAASGSWVQRYPTRP